MKLNEISSVDVYTRWWRDVEYGNVYYARKIIVCLTDGTEKVFTIRMTYGDVDRVSNDNLQKKLGLPKSVVFTDCEMFRWVDGHHTPIKKIRYEYHPAVRIWKEEGLYHPERFRPI